MSARSCNKGKRGERELAAALTAEGFDARRGAQHRGGPDSPDVLVPSLPGLHFEVKRTERLRLYEAVEQARREAGDEQIPVVCHRRNRHDWLAIMPLSALLAVIRESDMVATEAEALSRRLTPDLPPTPCRATRGSDVVAGHPGSVPNRGKVHDCSKDFSARSGIPDHALHDDGGYP